MSGRAERAAGGGAEVGPKQFLQCLLCPYRLRRGICGQNTVALQCNIWQSHGILACLCRQPFQSALQGYARYKQYDYRAVRTMHCNGCCRRSCSCGNIVAEQLDKTALIGCIWHARMQNSLLPTTICRFEG